VLPIKRSLLAEIGFLPKVMNRCSTTFEPERVISKQHLVVVIDQKPRTRVAMQHVVVVANRNEVCLLFTSAVMST